MIDTDTKARQWSGRDRSRVHPGYAPPRQCKWNGSRDCRTAGKKFMSIVPCLPRGADSTNITDERPMENVDQWRSGTKVSLLPGVGLNLIWHTDVRRCSSWMRMNGGIFPFLPPPAFFTLSLPWTRYLADIVHVARYYRRNVSFRDTAFTISLPS